MSSSIHQNDSISIWVSAFDGRQPCSHFNLVCILVVRLILSLARVSSCVFALNVFRKCKRMHAREKTIRNIMNWVLVREYLGAYILIHNSILTNVMQQILKEHTHTQNVNRPKQTTNGDENKKMVYCRTRADFEWNVACGYGAFIEHTPNIHQV